MSCPPGMILNPRTLRCIRSNSRIAHDLVQEGVIADYLVAPARKTYRQRGPRVPAPCRPDQQRNPITGRCKKINNRTYKRKLYSPPPPPAFQQKIHYGHQIPIGHQIPVGHQIPFQQRRMLSEGPARLGRRAATVAPMGVNMDWVRTNCRNQQDPLTGAQFAYMNPYDLQDVVRLHDRTCVGAQPLHYKVAGEHGAGRPATLPGHSGWQLKQEDFDALRGAMRRQNPGYKIPALLQARGSRFY